MSPAGAVRGLSVELLVQRVEEHWLAGEARSAVVQALSVELLVRRAEEHWLADAFQLCLCSFPLAATVLLPPAGAALDEAHSAVVQALSVELPVRRVEEHRLADAYLGQTSEFASVRQVQPDGLAVPCMELLPCWRL